jgi:hypothetical protein
MMHFDDNRVGIKNYDLTAAGISTATIRRAPGRLCGENGVETTGDRRWCTLHE